MTGLSTVIVKLDDGTGLFPYDISDHLRLVDGVTITRGRADQQSAVNPSTLTLTLENLDGRFTPGDPTYGMRINQRIRVIETVGFTYERFEGYIQSVAVSWPDGGEQFCVATVTAADLMTVLQRHLLRSIAEHEFLNDAPLALYPLSEASGSIAAGDVSGNGCPPLVLAGTGDAPAFGTEMHAAVAASGVQFAGGQYLSCPAPAGIVGIEIAFQTSDGASSNQQLIALENGTSTSWQLQITTGTLQAVRIVAGTPTVTVIASDVADGRPHVVFVGGASGMYFDGAPTAIGSPSIPAGASLTVGSGLAGVLAFAGAYPAALSDVRVAVHATAILDGFTADSSDARVLRLLGYAGIGFTSTTFEAGLQTTVPAQQTIGVSALDAIQQVANAEGGLFYIDAVGGPAFQNRYHRTVQTVPDWSVVAIDTDPGTAYIADTQNFANYATTKSVTGAEQVARNAASLAVDGQYPESLDLLVATDPEAFDRGSWLVNTRSAQRPKLPAVAINLLNASDAFQQTALGIELSDRLNASGMPSQTPATGDLIIEGWTETISATSWQMTLNTSAFAPYNAPIVDTASATVDTGYPVYF